MNVNKKLKVLFNNNSEETLMSEFQWHIVTVTCIPQKCPVVKNITMCTRTLRQHAVYE